jgi:tetratricopeptide (TPR) repeat protein
MQAQSPTPTPRASLWWTAALIFGLVLACYWPALHGDLVWDDDAHVTRPGLRSRWGLLQIWTNLHATQQYYPLLHSAFWVEHGLWGDATLGYHLTNVLLHAMASVLLVLVLRRLVIPGAWLAGLLFAVHPVCVESVAWISEQKNTLSLVFYLLAGLAYFRFDRVRGRPEARRAYALASMLFAFALLTKTVTATLPAALLVVFWWRNGRLSWRRDAAPLIPWFAFAAASGLFTSWVERTIGGAEGGEFDLTLVQRCLLAGRVVWFYLGKLLWPSQLAFIYPRWDARSAAAGWAGYLVAAMLVTAALWLLRRRTRGPLAAWLFYVGSLFPALGFFNVYPFLFSYVADHFQYLASMGIFAAFSAGAVPLFERASANARAAGLGLVAALVAALVVLSNAQSQSYEDARTLYTATLERNPECWMARNNLGTWYRDHGDTERAVAQYKEALRLRKDYAQAHNNLGLWCEDKGDLDGAIAHFREAIRLKGNFPAAHNNLGGLLGKMPGRLDEAVAEFREALRLQPEFAEAHVNLGTALLRTPGRLNEAIAQYEEAIGIDPSFAAAHASLGDALSNIPDRLDEAVAQYEAALRLEPGNAEVHNNLGLALNAQGRAAEAIDQYEEALRLRPAFAEIRLNIAIALLGMPGRRMEAAQQLEAYLQVRPANDTTRQILAQIQAAQP